MTAFSWKAILGSTKQVLWNLILIAVGSILCAIGINGILIPQHFLSGGFTGVALIIHYLAPSLPIAMLYFILNIPIFALGWMYVGRRFFLYSIAGLLIFSGALICPNILLPVHDKILTALLAGIIIGLGSGIILRSLGSAGGLDILSIILMKRFSIRLGTSILACNALILGVGAVLFSLEMALYTLIYLYVNSSVVNLVVMGLSQRKAVHIISPKWETIAHEIHEKIHRGVTIMQGEGGYTREKHQVLYTVISFQELPRLKRLITVVDPDAFVVVTDTLEVMGQRVGNQPHW
ncbi:MAG: YitT family protein [Thermodesulfobacteriota bacterium]|jgi:uncharacterized membrane-anchored protein YitT (DUF2179 family)